MERFESTVADPATPDWTVYEEQLLRRGLAKRKHRVDRLRALTGWSFDELLAEVRLLVWKGLCRWDPSKGATRERWLAWKTDYAVRELERQTARQLRRTGKLLGAKYSG